VYEIIHRRAEIIPRLAVFLVAEQSPTINLVVVVMLLEEWRVAKSITETGITPEMSAREK
jgi:hypothetical protein